MRNTKNSEGKGYSRKREQNCEDMAYERVGYIGRIASSFRQLKKSAVLRRYERGKQGAVLKDLVAFHWKIFGGE